MMNQEKIQELVSRSQQDDKRAFALLVSEFQPLVFRLLTSSLFCAII